MPATQPVSGEFGDPQYAFPVVPNGKARIRTQISAGHEIEHLDKALEAFIKVGKKYDVLGKSKQEIIAQYGL